MHEQDTKRCQERREADRPIAPNRWNCDSETKQTLRSHKLMNHQPFVQNFFDTFLIVFQTIVRQREKRLLSSKKVLGMFFSEVKGEERAVTFIRFIIHNCRANDIKKSFNEANSLKDCIHREVHEKIKE
jgi:hypothetical protein